MLIPLLLQHGLLLSLLLTELPRRYQPLLFLQSLFAAAGLPLLMLMLP